MEPVRQEEGAFGYTGFKPPVVQNQTLLKNNGREETISMTNKSFWIKKITFLEIVKLQDDIESMWILI